MKKRLFRAIAIILVLIILFFVVPGFMKNRSVVIDNYIVSADGKRLHSMSVFCLPWDMFDLLRSTNNRAENCIWTFILRLEGQTVL